MGPKREKYFVTFTEYYSRYAVTYCTTDKRASTILQKFNEFHPWLKRTTGQKLKYSRSDEDGASKGELKTRLLELGVEVQVTNPDTSQSNGVPERINLTLLDIVRSVLATTHLSRHLWPYLVTTATNLYNRRPHRGTKKTPYECLKGHQPDLSHLRAIGSVAYALVPEKGRHKMANRAQKCSMLGYGESEGRKGYQLWHPPTWRVFITRDVVTWRESETMDEKWREDPETLDLLDAPDTDDEEEYEVQCILDERESKTAGHEYFVKWVGFVTPTWTAAVNVEECEALDRWEQLHATNLVEVHAAAVGGGSKNWKQAMKLLAQDTLVAGWERKIR